MRITEENLKEMLNIEDLKNASININKAIKSLNETIYSIENAKGPRKWSDESPEAFISLVKDLWSLKETSREILQGLANGTLKRETYISYVPICKKIVSVWSASNDSIYWKLQKLNKVIDEHKKKFPKSTLTHVEDLIGIPIRASVTTEEVNYFPY